MLKNQEARECMSTTDLLLASLSELQQAYEKMRLPDFFNNKFNHLQRYKDKRYEASKIAEKIGEILNDPMSVLKTLEVKQGVFRAEQEKRMAEALRDVRPASETDIEEWVLGLGGLKKELSSANLREVISWMEAKRRLTDRICRDERGTSKKIHDEWGTWERRLREKYLEFFSRSKALVGDSKRETSGDKLTKEIIGNFNKRCQTYNSVLTKLKLLEDLVKILEEPLQVRLVPFGSSFTTLGIEGSDLDLMVCPKPTDSLDKVQQLEKVLELLKMSGCVQGEPTLVRSARTPVLKMTDEGTGLNIDLVVELGEPLALRNAHLFLHLALLDHRVSPLVLALRHWAEHHDVNNTMKHSLSSHALTILALHFLTAGVSPPVLPNLMQDQPQLFSPDVSYSNLQFGVNIPWQSKNRKSVGELFKVKILLNLIFIKPKSDHCLPMPATD